ncbi:hypothetical protein POM88_045305 [Heracleum sosnowskyi]|uniref:Glycine-rich protein n=1 Tax=Heracleum sosnowskyi TaxID=360622 RepID=A0AAD8H5P7_9APIA|nr:hypothetical protein POM88_045305 [Heracleum sosnowskyi]
MSTKISLFLLLWCVLAFTTSSRKLMMTTSADTFEEEKPNLFPFPSFDTGVQGGAQTGFGGATSGSLGMGSPGGLGGIGGSGSLSSGVTGGLGMGSSVGGSSSGPFGGMGSSLGGAASGGLGFGSNVGGVGTGSGFGFGPFGGQMGSGFGGQP